MKGRIIKVISNDYTVKLENNNNIICKPRGVFRNINLTPFAGDIVEIDENKGIFFTIRKIEVICFNTGICFLAIATPFLVWNTPLFHDGIAIVIVKLIIISIDTEIS